MPSIGGFIRTATFISAAATIFVQLGNSLLRPTTSPNDRAKTKWIDWVRTAGTNCVNIGWWAPKSPVSFLFQYFSPRLIRRTSQQTRFLVNINRLRAPSTRADLFFFILCQLNSAEDCDSTWGLILSESLSSKQQEDCLRELNLRGRE